MGEAEQSQANDTATCRRSIPYLVITSLDKGKAVPRRVQQCERSPRALCTGTIIHQDHDQRDQSLVHVCSFKVWSSSQY